MPGVQSDVFTETWLKQDIPDDNISISGLQTVRDNRDHTGSVVNVKEGDLLFSSTTVGVILVTLTSKNGSVAQTLNCRLLGSGHIISPGSFHMPLRSCLSDLNHISAYSFLFFHFYTYKEQL